MNDPQHPAVRNHLAHAHTVRAYDRELARLRGLILEMGERVVPMGRLAQPVEIARMVRFLCSDEASYITGAMHYVDAGYSAV